MPKKQLRTVKKSSQTGRLSRAAVRSAVITVRDGHTPDEGRNGGSRSPHSARDSGASNGGGKS